MYRISTCVRSAAIALTCALFACDNDGPETPPEPVRDAVQTAVSLENLRVERVETAHEWRDARKLPTGRNRVVELGVAPESGVFRAGFLGTTPAAQLSGQLLADGSPVMNIGAQGDAWQDGRIDLTPLNAAGKRVAFRYTSNADFWIGPGEIIAPSNDRPNILFFLIDTVRQDHMSCYGYARETTPNMDVFLPDAIRFTQLVPQSSWTRPSIASFFTSTYPAEHGAVDNTDPIRERLPRLAEALSAAGYECHGFVSNLNTLPQWGFAEGFARYVDMDSLRWHSTDPAHVVDAAIATIANAAGRPWFQFVHSIGAHHPYQPPAEFAHRFQDEPLTRDDARELLDTCAEELSDIYALLGMRPGDPSLRDPANTVETVAPRLRQACIDWYDGEIAYNDAQFQRLIDALKQTGQYDNTIIVVVSDHGEEFWEHGGVEHGYTLYEEQLRIPFLVKLPDSQLGGTTIESVVEGVDIAPTLIELVDAPPEPRFRGRSLLPVINGEPDADRLGFAALNLRQYSIRAVKSPSLKQIIYPLVSRTEWFDLVQDPLEQRPIPEPEDKGAFDAFARAAGMVGAEGIHVFIKCALAEEQVFEGRVTCDNLQDFELRNSDGVAESEMLPEGMRFRVEMKPVAFYPFESMVGRKPWQEIHLYLAAKQAETFALDLTVDGEPVSVDAVEAGDARASVPLDGSPLTVSELAAPLSAYDKGRFPDAFGVYLWYVPATSSGDASALDPEVAAALRGMGYLD
jgi:arylsulfatase A-like enzyme